MFPESSSSSWKGSPQAPNLLPVSVFAQVQSPYIIVCVGDKPRRFYLFSPTVPFFVDARTWLFILKKTVGRGDTLHYYVKVEGYDGDLRAHGEMYTLVQG